MRDTVTPHNLFWVLGEQHLGPLEFYFAKALRNNGLNVNYFNIHTLYPGMWKTATRYSHRFPRKYDNLIQRKYLKIINDELKKKYLEEKPAFIFIYNDCKVLPETISFFKKSGTKVFVFLGDDPNYLFPGKKTFLLTVLSADAVILPDTGWIEGLKILDANKVIFSPMGTDSDIFFPIKPTQQEMDTYGADILFIGTGYFLNSWGIRRATILNELVGMNFKLLGDKLWKELFFYFPELEKHYICKSLSASEVNVACNCAKIYPVLVNAGVINGVSTRIFDCLASGIFIIAEYRKDLERLFPNNELIFFRTKNELRDKIMYFLKNENEMNELKNKAREVVLRNYTLDISVKNILEQII